MITVKISQSFNKSSFSFCSCYRTQLLKKRNFSVKYIRGELMWQNWQVKWVRTHPSQCPMKRTSKHINWHVPTKCEFVVKTILRKLHHEYLNEFERIMLSQWSQHHYFRACFINIFASWNLHYVMFTLFSHVKKFIYLS